MRILLIIPAYNESASIEAVVKRVIDFAKSRTAYTLDYVVINDGSTDGTGEICRANGFRTVHLIQNLGIGGAVQTGYILARRLDYDIAVQFDGDGQHDLNSLDALVAPILSGQSNFVVGSRFLSGESGFRSTKMRQLGIRIMSAIIRLTTHLKITDPTSGFRAADRKAIRYLADHYPVDYPEPESLVSLSKQNLTISEVQVNMFERTGGVSSITPLRSVYYMTKVSLAIICASFMRRKGE